MNEEFRMNLQLFADEAPEGTEAATTEPTNESSGQTFTMEEVTRLIQSEADSA